MTSLEENEIWQLKQYFSAYYNLIQIIIWVRSPLAWAHSMCQQYLKQGAKTLDDLNTSPPAPKFKQIIVDFVNVFGKSQVSI